MAAKIETKTAAPRHAVWQASVVDSCEAAAQGKDERNASPIPSSGYGDTPKVAAAAAYPF